VHIQGRATIHDHIHPDHLLRQAAEAAAPMGPLASQRI
jgi:hypothetical protein